MFSQHKSLIEYIKTNIGQTVKMYSFPIYSVNSACSFSTSGLQLMFMIRFMLCHKECRIKLVSVSLIAEIGSVAKYIHRIVWFMELRRKKSKQKAKYFILSPLNVPNAN